MANVEHYHHLPAGDYYIGDLCYVVENWQEYHKLFFPVEGGEQRVGVFTNSAGVKFANYGTAFGDGIYYDEKKMSMLLIVAALDVFLLKQFKNHMHWVIL